MKLLNILLFYHSLVKKDKSFVKKSGNKTSSEAINEDTDIVLAWNNGAVRTNINYHKVFKSIPICNFIQCDF